MLFAMDILCDAVPLASIYLFGNSQHIFNGNPQHLRAAQRSPRDAYRRGLENLEMGSQRILIPLARLL
jgi:hypothetical protein